MGPTLFSSLIFTASVTLLVLMNAVILLALKHAFSRHTRSLWQLKECSGLMVSESLVAELPPASTSRSHDSHCEGYRKFVHTIERGWRRKRSRLRRSSLSVLTSTATDVSGETSERIVFLADELLRQGIGSRKRNDFSPDRLRPYGRKMR